MNMYRGVHKTAKLCLLKMSSYLSFCYYVDRYSLFSFTKKDDEANFLYEIQGDSIGSGFWIYDIKKSDYFVSGISYQIARELSNLNDPSRSAL